MMVYGDARADEAPAEKLARIRSDLTAAGRAPVWIRGHGRLVGALIESGELAQGLLDAGHAEAGALALALATDIAGRVISSWQNGRVPPANLSEEASLGALAAMVLPALVSVTRPEGFAHYAVYPEAYALAAQSLTRTGSPVVIGIRSIGTTLAATVAAALGRDAPLTVRPTGHPFDRTVELPPDFAPDPKAPCLVVDEGPGLSGSSLAAVAVALAERGVATDRIAFLPSHSGEPGPRASTEVRRVWARTARHVRTLDDLALAENAARPLASWVADAIGEAVAPPDEVSGGAWRRHGAWPAERWPPAQVAGERRKFLVHTQDGTWLLKFAGLGRQGLRKAERARALHEAGFGTETAGWRHGLLVERWVERDGRTVANLPRPELAEQVGTYLGLRAASFPAETAGASLELLLAMAAHNAGEALGPAAADAVRRRAADWASLARLATPVETDNRLHAWEWLPVGRRLLKTDALDHHAGHDLVGCQDVAWDVVGAEIELGLRADDILPAVERNAGRLVASELLQPLRVCYAAFQLGSFTMAEIGSDKREGARLRAHASRYEAVLIRELSLKLYPSTSS